MKTGQDVQYQLNTQSHSFKTLESRRYWYYFVSCRAHVGMVVPPLVKSITCKSSHSQQLLWSICVSSFIALGIIDSIQSF